MIALGDGDAEGGVEFVDGAVGLDAEVVFGDPFSVKEDGLSLVAEFGVDFHVTEDKG